ncbi:hypothetical protein LCGC14_1180550 [marine sediment metagenome]|uniref:DNA-directed DNA polymerase family A palm domain-containing protein n=1 Tax=marine sediment metagenome TaxID=412755 RepID=A0A0F9PSQ1_9ZZZZ
MRPSSLFNIAYVGPHDYTEEQLIERLKGESPATISIDTETISLKDRTCIGIGIGLNAREAVYFPILPDESKYLDLCWELLSRPSVKVFCNALYDLYAMTEFRADGEQGGGAWLDAIVQEARLPSWLGHGLLADISTMAHIQALPSGALAEMSRAYVGFKIDTIADILPERSTMLDLETADVARKCLDDCLATLRVYLKMDGPAWWGADAHTWSYEANWYDGCDPFEPTSYTVTQAMKDCYQVDMKLTPLLMRMSRRGIALRADLVEDWYERTSKARLFFEDICLKEGFQPGSNQQVGYVLAERGNFLPFTESRKQLATGEEILSQLNDPLAVVVLKYREYTKLKGTYLEKMRGQARSYTHFRMDLSTARLSSYDGNQQNIPERIREIFAPDTGVWTDADASQIELRVFAHVTNDPVMLKAYADGSDIHATTQMALWPTSNLKDKEMRRRAKVFNFAKIFYAIVKTLSAHTKLPEAVCREYGATWDEAYPTAHQWMKNQEEGEPWIENLYGRRCLLPHEIYHTWKHVVNCRICYPTQSGAADIIKRVMLECEAMGFDQALQVHDSILIDGKVDFPSWLDNICPDIHTPFDVRPPSPYWS